MKLKCKSHKSRSRYSSRTVIMKVDIKLNVTFYKKCSPSTCILGWFFPISSHNYGSLIRILTALLEYLDLLMESLIVKSFIIALIC